MTENLPLIVINEACIDIIGRVYAHFNGDTNQALWWLITKHEKLNNYAPLYLINYGRGKRVLDLLTKKQTWEEWVVSNGEEPKTKITMRDKEIAELLSEGKSYKQIMVALSISKGTLIKCVRRAYRAYGVSNKMELARLFAKQRSGKK